MNTTLLLVSLALAVIGPWLALTYMRPILLQVLRGMCATGQGVEFWMRSAYVLAITGTLLMILTFGAFDEGASLAESMRRNVWLVLAGIFVTIAYIARTIQKSMPRRVTGPALGGHGGKGAEAGRPPAASGDVADLWDDMPDGGHANAGPR